MGKRAKEIHFRQCHNDRRKSCLRISCICSPRNVPHQNGRRGQEGPVRFQIPAACSASSGGSFGHAHSRRVIRMRWRCYYVKIRGYGL